MIFYWLCYQGRCTAFFCTSLKVRISKLLLFCNPLSSYQTSITNRSGVFIISSYEMNLIKTNERDICSVKVYILNIISNNKVNWVTSISCSVSFVFSINQFLSLWNNRTISFFFFFFFFLQLEFYSNLLNLELPFFLTITSYN